MAADAEKPLGTVGPTGWTSRAQIAGRNSDRPACLEDVHETKRSWTFHRRLSPFPQTQNNPAIISQPSPSALHSTRSRLRRERPDGYVTSSQGYRATPPETRWNHAPIRQDSG